MKILKHWWQDQNFLRRTIDIAILPFLGMFLSEVCHRRVASGPFKDMIYGGSSVGSVNLPKLLGTYECELHSSMELFKGGDFSHVIDIGAAEGYYAVGFARCLPSVQVVAFERDALGRRLLLENALLNDCADRIKIAGNCDPAALQETLATADNVLLFCDAEGAENELIRCINLHSPQRTWIACELHEWISPGIAESLQNEFSETHQLKFIPARSRQPGDFPLLQSRMLRRVFGGPLKYIMQERRPANMSWLIAIPKS